MHVHMHTYTYTHKLKVIKIFLKTNTYADGNPVLEVSLCCIYCTLTSKNIKVESTVLKDNQCSVEMSPQLQGFSKTMNTNKNISPGMLILSL